MPFRKVIADTLSSTGAKPDANCATPEVAPASPKARWLREPASPSPPSPRIERGQDDPRVGTLDRLLRACDETLATVPLAGTGIDRTEIRVLLARTPAQRVESLMDEARLLDRLTHARRIDRGGVRPRRRAPDPPAFRRPLVIIGGIAGRIWGSPTMTNDVDICYDRDPSTLERLAAALKGLHARLRGVDADVPFLLDAVTLAKGQNITFTTDLGRSTSSACPPGVKDFNALAVNTATFDLGDGVVVQVCDLDDLIRMKRAAGRPKDRIELEILTAVREERDRTPDR